MNQPNPEDPSPSEKEFLKDHVKKLYNHAESIRRILQLAALNKNPNLLNNKLLLNKGLVSNEPDEPFEDMERGRFTLDLMISRVDEDLIPNMPKFELEEHMINSLSLTNQMPPPVEEFKGRFYMFSFQAEVEEDTPLFWSFYFSQNGDWYKQRTVEVYEGEEETGTAKSSGSQDVNIHDLEIVTSAISTLKSYITAVLTSNHE